MVYCIIMIVNERAETQTDQDKNYSAYQFPLPGQYQQSNQDKGRNQMNDKCSELLPDGEPLLKSI